MMFCVLRGVVNVLNDMIFMMLMIENAINLFIVAAFICVFKSTVSINLILLMLIKSCFAVIYFEFIKAFFFSLIVMIIKFTLLMFMIE